MLDGAPDAVKVACPVLAGGKAGDNIKGLPIGTVCIYQGAKGHPDAGKHTAEEPETGEQRTAGRPVL